MSRAEYEDQKVVSTEPLWHCQICGREIKAATGIIAHHGYERPGDGWQSASCSGARWKPYEVSRDAIPDEINRIKEWIDGQAERIARVRIGNVPFPNPYWRPGVSEKISPMIEPGSPRFEEKLQAHIRYLETQVVDAEGVKVFLQKRYDNWQPKIQEAHA